ncbi:site-specific integrase [Planosporangium flavigriseum]|uniref:Site-specific integrase n=1 Tax=Planosporangium flavigriseum TaxID=373681 RepID=A0A8J3PQ34_9ACTN|nr:tyrosine-type recombinase/integrase [Planosporangium flavigriseum]NJC66754.1 site-specific integrase [Planosporangium flavigriseum]GIG76548.1 site-specific integrase [Planosporangium flavigriseum]
MSGNRRRSHGEGSVFKYRDGFAAVIDLGWVGGKRRRKWVYGKTERETLGKLADLRRRQEQGQDLTAAPRTLGEWLDEWLRMKERDGTRPLTLRGYRVLIENHIRPALGKVALDKLSPTMVRRLLTDKTDQGLSATTVRHVHGLIRNALGDAEREELVHRNVARAVRPPSMKRPERRALTVEEARRLLGVLKGHRLEALYVTALTVGLRRGELLGLRWHDIDLDAGTLTVRQTVHRVDGRLEFAEPKTDRSRRTVPVPPPTIELLRTHRRRQVADRLAAGERWQDHGLVFASRVGTPIEPDNLDRSWHVLRANAGLDWLRIHDLRHACATFLLASGASPRTVMKMLGHSQIGLTMNTYAHVLPEIERAAVDAATEHLFG